MTTPYMALDWPVPGITAGPIYAQKEQTAIGLIDAHDHTPGHGALVPTAGLNINATLAFQSNDAAGLRMARFDNQSGSLGSSNIRGVYVVNGDLYYNNAAGTAVQITSGGSVAGAAGNISGLASPAAVTWDSTNKIFAFTQNSNFPAKIQSGDLILYETVSAPTNAVTIKSPSGLASAYSLTLPAAVPVTSALLYGTTATLMTFLAAPAATSFLQQTAGGTLSWVLALPANFTLGSPILSGTPTGSWTNAPLTTPLINASIVNLALPLSTVQDFKSPPSVVASAGGAGNQITNVGGKINFGKTAHARLSGDAVQLTTSSALPTGLSLATTYYVVFIDANNFQLSATGAYGARADGLAPFTPGAAIAYTDAGTGNQTVTPGFIPQTNQNSADIDAVAGGGGGGGGSGNAVATAGTAGSDTTIGTLGWTLKGGPGGAAGQNTNSISPAGGTAPADTASTVTSGRVFKGRDGMDGVGVGSGVGVSGTAAPGRSDFGGYGDGGKGGKSHNTTQNGAGGGGGASGARGVGRPPVTPGTWYAVIIGAGGPGGPANGSGATNGEDGKTGWAQVRM